MKKLFFKITVIVFLFLFSNKPVFAGILKVSLSNLPDYKNSTNFRLYYTYIETDGNQANVNLFIQKDGRDWRQTQDKNKTTVSGYFQLEGSDIYDGEGKYNFYVTAQNGGNSINSNTVSTTLDMNSPSAVTDFSKEKLNPTTYKLSWKNPFDQDFGKVYVYRSKLPSFTADSDTKIAEVNGGKEEKITFNDGSIEADVEYFYALRAVDRAGNSSGLVTDAPGTVQAGQVAGISVKGSSAGGNLTDRKETKVIGFGEGEIGGGVSTSEGEIKGDQTNGKMNRYLIYGFIVVLIILLFGRHRKKK